MLKLGYLKSKTTKRISPTILTSIKPIALTVVLLTIIGDILVVGTKSDIIIFTLLFSYLLCLYFFRLSSKETFFFSLGILITMYAAYLIFGASVRAEKAAIWLFLFFAIGIFQQWKELKK